MRDEERGPVLGAERARAPGAALVEPALAPQADLLRAVYDFACPGSHLSAHRRAADCHEARRQERDAAKAPASVARRAGDRERAVPDLGPVERGAGALVLGRAWED
jgi:hypothetical protein